MTSRNGSAIALTMTMILASASAFAAEVDQLAAQAKITMTEARSIALKTFPGRIASAELEQEQGGSGLRYSFDIQKGDTWHEVGVDAKTGRVLEDRKESPNPTD